MEGKDKQSIWTRRLNSYAGLYLVLLALTAGGLAGVYAAKRTEKSEVAASAPAFRDIEHRFAATDSLAGVLTQSGVNPQNVSDWIQALSRTYSLSQIREGQDLSLRVDVTTSDLVSLKLDIDDTTYLAAHRENGVIVSKREAINFARFRRVVSGRADHS